MFDVDLLVLVYAKELAESGTSSYSYSYSSYIFYYFSYTYNSSNKLTL
jgi:hypothetical protein